MQSFAVLTNIGAGLGSLAYAAALLGREVKPPLFIRFALLLLAVGGGLLCRGFYYLDPDGVDAVWAHGMHIGFSLFPLLAALVIERLVHRHLPLWCKLLLLAGTPSFVVTSCTFLIWQPIWLVASGIFQVGMLLYFVFFTSRSPVRETRAERELRKALLLGSSICLPLVATDWLNAVKLVPYPLGTVGVFALLFLGASALHAGGTFRLIQLLQRVLWATSSSLVLALLLTLVWHAAPPVPSVPSVPSAPSAPTRSITEISAEWPKTASMALLLLFAWLVAEPLRMAVLERQARPRELLLERLAALPTHSLPALLDALRAWPEITHAEHIKTSFLVDHGLNLVPKDLEKYNGLVDEAFASALLRNAENPEALAEAERLLSFLMMSGHDAGLLLANQSIVGITFSQNLDASLYRPALRTLAKIVYLLDTQPEHKQTEQKQTEQKQQPGQQERV